MPDTRFAIAGTEGQEKKQVNQHAASQSTFLYLGLPKMER
jgi:hypothetical protein